MRNRLFFVAAILAFAGLWGHSAAAFDIQYPGESGFFIGKPMAYVITSDFSGEGEGNVGQEGIFIFGQDRIVINGDDYYDCVFDYPDSVAHFYLGIDSTEEVLLQKGFAVGQSELEIEPAVTTIRYPLSPGDSWSEGPIELTAKNIELPGLGVLDELSVNDAMAETGVYSEILSIHGGVFDSLLVETNYSGSLMGIPVTVVQRTWLSKENVTLKRSFDFVLLSNVLPIYEIELSKMTLTPWDVNWDGAVDLVDVVMVARSYGEEIPEPVVHSPDVNGDGIVDIHDLAAAGTHLGKNKSPAAPARYMQADDSSVALETLMDVYQEAKRQSYQLDGDALMGLEKLLRALESEKGRLGGIFRERPLPPAQNMLFQSFPNPCNPETWIPYSLVTDSPVTIGIYNVLGRLVRELDIGNKPAGIYASRSAAAYWDGRNNEGERVVSGIYFYTIRAGDFTATRRMLVLR